MLSQEAIDDCMGLYKRDPEELIRLYKFGNKYQKAASRAILKVVRGNLKEKNETFG